METKQWLEAFFAFCKAYKSHCLKEKEALLDESANEYERLVEHKQALNLTYQKLGELFMGDTKIQGALTPDEKKKLKSYNEDIQLVTERHLAFIQRTMDQKKKMLQTLFELTKKQQPTVSFYNERGAHGLGTKSPITIRMNQRI